MGSKQKVEPAGYIVTSGGWPLYVSKHDGVLYLSRPISIFATKAQANAAIRTSVAHAIEKGYSWQKEDYYVRRALQVLRTPQRRRRRAK